MKTMTCRQMGGPCDEPITGETAEEMTDNGTKHVMSKEDEEHKRVLVMMQDMMKDLEAMKKWNEDFAKKFAELPED